MTLEIPMLSYDGQAVQGNGNYEEHHIDLQNEVNARKCAVLQQKVQKAIIENKYDSQLVFKTRIYGESSTFS